MIIRHGEKPDSSGNPPGIDEKGQQDPHSLTERGWARARALGKFFAAPKAGIVRPARVYAPGQIPGHAAGRRPRQTAVQIAAALGLGVDLVYKEGEEKKLANQLSILGPNLPSLVVWEHSAIAEIVDRLDGPVAPKAKSWPDSRYDVVLVCRANKSGWKLAQVPEMVLPGDRSSGL